MAERDTFVAVSDGDQLNEGYFNGSRDEMIDTSSGHEHDGTDSKFLPIGARILLFPHSADSEIQGTWAIAINTSQAFNAILSNVATTAVNDGVRFKSFLRVGTYTIRVLHMTDTNFGIAHLSINGVEKLTVDGYNNPAQANQVDTTASVSVTTDSYVNIDLEINTKNGSSSDYMFSFMCIEFERTA